MNKISANKQKKIAITDELSAKVTKSKGFVFTDYTGLTHQQLEGLKRGMKKLDAEFIVTKNTLLKRALSTISVVASSSSTPRNNEQSSVFDKPTATLFAYNDLIEPLKILTKLIKELNIPVIKAGLLEGNWLNEAQVTKLATLPAKPVLQGQLLGMMQSPIQGLHRSLTWNLQRFVIVLSAIEQKKA